MKYQKTILFLVLMSVSAMMAYGAALKVPERVEPGAMFVIQAEFGPTENAPARVEFDPRTLQFLGAVIPSSDLQLRDRMVEIIAPSGNNGSRTFGLKFLPIVPASSTELVLKIADRSIPAEIRFLAPEGKTSYHMHFLVLGLILVVLGTWFWRTQKKHVGLMSTRSLFLNFEQLEKMRAEMFPAPSGKAEEPNVKTTGPEVVPSKSASEPLFQPPPVEPPPDTRSDNATRKKMESSVATDEKVHPSEAETVVKPTVSSGTQIHVTLIDASGRRFEGKGADEISIGRRNTCTIVLTASEVSRNHCVIRKKGLTWAVVPLTTSNRTEVNGVMATESAPCPIKTGDTLGLGGTPFTVEIREG